MQFIISTGIASVSLLLSLWLAWKGYINNRRIYKSTTIATNQDWSETLTITLYTQSSSPIQIYEWKVYAFSESSTITHYSPNNQGHLILTIGTPVTFSFDKIQLFNFKPLGDPRAAYLKLKVIGRKRPIIKEITSQFYIEQRPKYFKRRALIKKVKEP